MIAFIFDTETTGLVKNSLVPLQHQPRIIEFCGFLVDDSLGYEPEEAVIDEVEFLCNPGVPIDPVITRITGIKPEDVEGKAMFSEYADQVLEKIGAADAAVAHNLSFDMALVEADLLRCSADAFLWPHRLFCTVEQTEWIKGHRLSLGALHEELFGEPFKGAHRARTDVMALTKCYLELRKRGDL